ncbi:MAG: hypothetical protein KDA72_15885, partial [Planctomycetales bacterium]|nr:hypothetical protein [Planctomycetales bacterium]
MKPVDIRKELQQALQLDLVGPNDGLGDIGELLPQSPSRWYLTGFLVPTEAEEAQKCDPTSNDELDQAATPAGLDDDSTPEPVAARRSYLPSSMGVSVLVPPKAASLKVTVNYGEYLLREKEEGETGPDQWKRVPHSQSVVIELGKEVPNRGRVPVPNSRGLEIDWSIRGVPDSGIEGGLPDNTRSLSIFLVNHRKPADDKHADEASVFQAQLIVESEQSFVARPNLRSLESDDWDECVADIQYRDACEFSVGHGVSTEAIIADGQCRTVRTCWIPSAEVERVAPAAIPGIELRMEELASLKDVADAKQKLGNFVEAYSLWIEKQKSKSPASPQRRKETAELLLQ